SDSISLVHAGTGTVYLATAQYLPYTVYQPRERALASGIDDSRLYFLGWDAVSGWTPKSGPFPQWNLPVVLWGLAPSSRLRFSSDGQPMQLIAECRGNACPEQLMTIKLNGTEIHQQPFDGPTGFTCLRLPLPARPGTNQVEFTYRHGQPAMPGESLGVLF